MFFCFEGAFFYHNANPFLQILRPAQHGLHFVDNGTELTVNLFDGFAASKVAEAVAQVDEVGPVLLDCRTSD